MQHAWGRSKMHIGFWWASQKEEDHQENLDIDERIKLETGCSGMDWIDLAQNRDQWRALVYTVINLWVP
jgi:hypothetical protein